jgi:nucleoside-diphosphate-sugar epimerase
MFSPKTSPLVGAFNFGPGVQADVPVSKLVESILELWPGEWEQAGGPNEPHEATRLNLAIDKAATMLQWWPTWSFPEAIQQTVSWYHQRHVGASKDMLAGCILQLETFAAAARSKGLAWALAPQP